MSPLKWNPAARLVRAGNVREPAVGRSLLSRAGLRGGFVIGVAGAIVGLSGLSLHAAKPAKIEKYERKLERAGMADLVPVPPPRQTMAAPASVPSKPERSDRSSKAERAERERAERSERAESSDRAAAASLPADGKFDAFRVIVDRNIFNPNRSPRTRAVPEEKPPRVEEISLVGTMHYDKGVVAFFDSSDSEYRKNLREGDSIAGFKVRKIMADGVELVRDDQPVALRVAQQLRRREGGDWTVTAAPVRTDERTSGAADGVRASAEAAAAEIPADASEALKRLMEKRKQQLSK
jgi:hypothetical protein